MATGEPSTVPSLTEMTNAQLLRSFSSALGNANEKATFACGGRIPIVSNPPPDDSGNVTPRTAREFACKVMDQLIITKPVTIRYDGVQGEGQTLRLPTDTTQDQALLRLISTCQPATFGVGGRNILDETYRKAVKLDTTDFCSDFCPYETGIIDVVSQLLLPTIQADVVKRDETIRAPPPEPLSRIDMAKRDADVQELYRALHANAGPDELAIINIMTSRTNHELFDIVGAYRSKTRCDLRQDLRSRLDGYVSELMDELLGIAVAEGRTKHLVNHQAADTKSAGKGIRAELYKLNVYSGPSGKFKSHVDTPRSETQIGSLVVCLPSDFEGGALSVHHQRNTVKFDWPASSNPEPAIQWAAFYSDCEHEVHEVTAGHRFTLTYNLYASRGTGLLAGEEHNMDPTQLPLYRPLIDLLDTPCFMVKGGILGVGSSHAYLHTHQRLYQAMPAALKGADMMLYETLRASGVKFRLGRTMESKDVDWLDEDDLDDDSEDEGVEPTGPFGDLDTLFREGFGPMDVPAERLECWTMREHMEPWEHLKNSPDVTWLQSSRSTEPEMIYMAYGNEAAMAIKYSSVSFLIAIPPFSQRKTRSNVASVAR